MTRPTILAIIEDGPRAGDTVHLDAEAKDHPPKEFLLADEHLGAPSRPPYPSLGLGVDLLPGGPDEERGGYV